MSQDNELTTVVSVDAPVAAVRLMESATAEKTEWTSNEFISLAGTVAVNLITAATVVGWVDATQAQELTKAVTAIAAAVSVISVNGLVMWKYLGGKQEVQVQKIVAQYRYAEVVAVEQRIAEQQRLELAKASPRRK